MSEKKVKASELWEAVQEVAAGHPDRIYWAPNGSECVYQYEGQPSCLVGHGLIECGLSIEILKGFDHEEENVYGLFQQFPEYLELDDHDAIQKLSSAQRDQDQGTAWGKAARLGERASA